MTASAPSQPAGICPVCGYPSLGCEPYHDGQMQLPSFSLCSCCGTEFGFDDSPGASGIEVPFDGDPEENPEAFHRAAFAVLRRRWVESGMTWFYPRVPPPPGWNPAEQLQALLDSGAPPAH